MARRACQVDGPPRPVSRRRQRRRAESSRYADQVDELVLAHEVSYDWISFRRIGCDARDKRR